jgi:hypothetical protein
LTDAIDVERIEHDGQLLACVVPSRVSPDKSVFVTDPGSQLQAGFIVCAEGNAISPHVHLPVRRNVLGTPEVIIVKKGKCYLDVYTPDRVFLTTRDLNEGDIVILSGGGHGFRMAEDTVLFEVKQGPYAAEKDKEKF